MPGWIIPDLSFLRSLMLPAELAAIDRATGGPDGWNTAAAMADAVSFVRSYCGEKGLGEDGTIPPECRYALGAIFRFRMLSSIPNESLMTPARELEYDKACKYLADISAGRAKVTLPDPAGTGQDQMTSGTASPWICAPVRTRSLRDLDGS